MDHRRIQRDDCQCKQRQSLSHHPAGRPKRRRQDQADAQPECAQAQVRVPKRHPRPQDKRINDRAMVVQQRVKNLLHRRQRRDVHQADLVAPKTAGVCKKYKVQLHGDRAHQDGGGPGEQSRIFLEELIHAPAICGKPPAPRPASRHISRRPHPSGIPRQPAMSCLQAPRGRSWSGRNPTS